MTNSPLERMLASLGPLEDASSIVDALTRLEASGMLALPLPAQGNTIERFRALSEIAAVDLSLARLAEGHVDAIAILAEARRTPRAGLYGVWAADPPDARVEAERTPAGWTLRGRKRYASGARRIQHALVTAHTTEGIRLFDLSLDGRRIRTLDGTWRAVGMAATESLEIVLDAVELPENSVVGESGFYLTRPGFWHGAIGVAACWYGGALGAFRMLRRHLRRNGASEHQAAHLGAIATACASMKSILDAAAIEIDSVGANRDERGRERALVARNVVEQACQEVLLRTGRASGSNPLVFDRAHAQRAADLVVYLRQHHAERDLEALGRLVIEGDA